MPGREDGETDESYYWPVRKFRDALPGREGCIRKRGTPGPIYMLLYRCFVRGRVWWWTYRYTAHRGRGLRIDKNASQAGASQKRTARMKKMRAGLMRWSCHIEVLAKQIPGRPRGHDVDVRMCRHSPIPVRSTLHPPLGKGVRGGRGKIVHRLGDLLQRRSSTFPGYQFFISWQWRSTSWIMVNECIHWNGIKIVLFSSNSAPKKD